MASSILPNHNSRTEDFLATYNALLHEVESYTNFFKKRCEIEDDYQHALSRLVSRQNDIDRKLACEYPDGLIIPHSSRQAWQEMCSNVQQEARLRQNWIRLIKQNVIEPLERFKSSRERTLQRIRDELRSSIVDHKEYLSTVQRLKKTYDRKCEEVVQLQAMSDAMEVRDKLIEDQKAANTTDWDHTITTLNNPLTTNTSSITTSPVPSSDYNPNLSSLKRFSNSSNFRSRSSSHSIDQTVVINPNSNNSHSVSPSSRRSTDHQHQTPAKSTVIISGATSSALRDTATPPPANPIQAKGTDVLHALRANTNNLIQRLNSRKESKSTAPTTNPIEELITRPSALRAVKVKRDAEDADRDYRKGVFHLETLRLRKEQVIRGARRATEEMVYEISGEAKESFSYYNDETRIQAVSWISVCDHAQHFVMKINPESDMREYTESTAFEHEEPKVLYENAFIGPCLSLLFGVAINDYCASNPGKGPVPLLVRMCIEEIERNGLRQEGIYRISGKMQNVIQLVHEIEKDEDSFKFDSERHDVYTISGVLKLYLRQLPQALFPFPLVERVSFSQQLEESRPKAFKILLKRIKRLPLAHQATLKLLCEHLNRVASCSAQNKMTTSNLGLVFSPVVFLDVMDGQQLPAQSWKDDVMEVLIDYHAEIFEGLPTAEAGDRERSQSLQSSVRARTISPSARKSLEAVRYESYSASGSPQMSPNLNSAPEGIETLSISESASTDPSSGPQAAGASSPSLHPDGLTGGLNVTNLPKRTFSLRRKHT